MKKGENKKLDEIDQIVVPGALNHTKKIRKAGADVFANVGLEKPSKNYDKSVFLWILLNFHGFCLNRAESTYNRLAPIWRPAVCPVARR